MPKIDYDGVKVKINERISTETGNIDDNANEYKTITISQSQSQQSRERTIFVRRVNHCQGHQ